MHETAGKKKNLRKEVGTMRECYPDELDLKISGRVVWKEHELFLSHSASYVEFLMDGVHLEAEFASEGGGKDFQAWIGIYVDDEEKKRIAIQEGANRYLLWESEEPKTVKIRVTKMSENQYAYASIRKFYMNDGAKITRTESRKNRIQFIGDSLTCGFGNEGNPGDPFETGTENPWKAYAVLTAEKLEAEATLLSWSGIGIISSYVDPDVEVPNTGVLVPVIYPYTDYSLQCRMGWEKQLFDASSEPCDLIVINLGTNDSSYTRDHADRRKMFEDAYTEFLHTLCERYENVPIVCTAGAMNDLLNAEILSAAETLNKEGKPVFSMAFLPKDDEDGEGAVGHPSLKRHEKMAEQLAGMIKDRKILY